MRRVFLSSHVVCSQEAHQAVVGLGRVSQVGWDQVTGWVKHLAGDREKRPCPKVCRSKSVHKEMSRDHSATG